MKAEFPLESLEFLVNRFPKTEKPLVILSPVLAERPLTLAKTKVLCKLLPKLETLHARYQPGWEKDAFIYFLQELEQNDNLKKLGHLEIPNWMTGQETCMSHNGSAATILRQTLQGNKSLEYLHLDAPEATLQKAQCWLQCLRMSVQNRNQTLQKVSIGFGFEGNIAANESSFLNSTMIGRGEESGGIDSEEGSFTVDLFFDHCNFSNDEFVRLLQQQPTLFGLSIVRLKTTASIGPSKELFTPAVRGLLKQANNIKSLQLENFNIDISSILDDLMLHKYLESFTASYENPRPTRRRPTFSLMVTKLTPEDTTACLEHLRCQNATLTKFRSAVE